MKASKFNFSKIALAIALTIGSASAMATKNGDDCNGRGSCSTDGGGSTSSATGVGVGIGVGVGLGGAGGHGGNATGGAASATGGSVGPISTSSGAGNVGNVGNFSTVKNLSPEANASAHSTNLNTNANTNTQGQQQGQGQQQDQGQAQSTDVKNAGNNTGTASVVINESSGLHYSGEYKVKNVGDVVLGAPASGPCNGFSGGFGVSGPGFNVGANASTVDYGCEQREAARVAAVIGRQDIAQMILMNMQVVKDAQKNNEAQKKAAAEASAPKMAADKRDQWVDETGKVVYVGTDETVIKRMGLKLASAHAVAAN